MYLAQTVEPSNFWQTPHRIYSNEADVETKLVLPLLRALGYESEDISPKHPVRFHEGRTGRPNEADFALFNGEARHRHNSLAVVEAKAPSEPISNAKGQAESYAMWLRCPLYLTTNGSDLEIWQIQTAWESRQLVSCAVQDIVNHRASIEGAFSKVATIEYKNSLQERSVLVTSFDVAAFASAELARRARQGFRVERTLTDPSNSLSSLSSSALRARYPMGAVIVAPSGYGKTTLLSQIHEQALGQWQTDRNNGLAIEIILPDMIEFGQELLPFIANRLRAHCPIVTTAIVEEMARKEGLVLLCDGYDRVERTSRRRVDAYLRTFRSDFPLSEIFVFTRRGLLPEVGSLTVLTLGALDSTQQLAIVDNHAESTGTDRRLYHWLTPAMRKLTDHPMLLSLILDTFATTGKAPRGILDLLDQWLERTLHLSDLDSQDAYNCQRALRKIAVATSVGPQKQAKLVQLLQKAGVPATALDKLIDTGTVVARGALLEVVHEIQADYARALDFLDDIESSDADVELLEFQPGSLLPVFLAALTSNREVQSKLWSKIARVDLSEYLAALHYRGDSSKEWESLSDDDASVYFLQEIVDSLELTLTSYFEPLRSSALSFLARQNCSHVQLQGHLGSERKSIAFEYKSRAEAEPRVLLRKPGPLPRYTNLELSGYRLDSARLVGVAHAKEAIDELVKTTGLLGREIWNEELRWSTLLCAQRHLRQQLIGRDPREIRDLLEPYSGAILADSSVYSREPSVFVDEVLESLAHFEDGVPLTPWWGLCPDEDHLDPVSLRNRSIERHFVRVQLAYREVVDESFPQLRTGFAYSSIFPVRYNLSIVEVPITPAAGRQTIYYDWVPVRTWDECDAHASVCGHDEPPIWHDQIDVIKARLQEYGRSSTHIRGTSFSPLPSFDGRGWRGFDGLSSVARDVCELIDDELKYVFEGLRPS